MSRLEVGQMLFGNPVESHEMPYEEWVRPPFDELVERVRDVLGPDADEGYVPEFSNEVFVLRPYYWGEDEGEAAKPNFEVFGEVRVTWYKYPFRGSYASELLTRSRWRELLRRCMDSLEG